MMPFKRALLLVVLCATPAGAQSKVWHWVTHHKEELALDGLYVAGRTLDGVSTQWAQTHGAEEGYPGRLFLGKHPGPPAIISFEAVFSVGLVWANHGMMTLAYDGSDGWHNTAELLAIINAGAVAHAVWSNYQGPPSTGAMELARERVTQ